MSHGILSGPEIEAQVTRGAIRISPFEVKHINPGSLDLTLGPQVRVYDNMVREERLIGTSVVDGRQLSPREDPPPLDSRSPNATRHYAIGEQGWLLKPGIGYLMHAKEHIWTNDYVPVVDGKSSLGRLFIKVHETAGYIDPGFDGQYTLEVTVVHPVRVYAGMRFCQVRFHTLVGKPLLYDGHYKGSTAQGAVASHSWEQF